MAQTPGASGVEAFRVPNPVSHLREPSSGLNDTPMRGTPDMSTEVDSRLKIETSDEDEYEDSLLSDTSSDPEDALPAPYKGLPVSKLRTGLCYDERMRYHSEIAATSGENVHPEDPRRIYYIYKELCEAGLVDDPRIPPIVEHPLLRIEAREATKEECLLVHTDEHYEFVKSTSEMTDEELIDLSEDVNMDSIYFNSLSYFSSKLSAGAAIETCRAVVSRKVKNAIAVIRPPGHHAEVHRTMGFCLFNNVCIASRVCQEDFGDECRKILIVDWDVHHGNGCQKAFYDDPNILYISLHVHMDGKFYPSGPEGDMYHCGVGAGTGKNVNIPWPTKGMGDGDYIYAFQSVVMPIATEFDPDFVIVASGFDAAAGDELGGCFVSPACYAHMTHMLMSLAGGKIAVCLEGGYNFQAISKSALAVTRTLMGEPPDRLPATGATSSAIDTIAKVRNVQSRYWRSIWPKEPVGGIHGGERLHDIIRQWQALHLYDKFKLTELHIFREAVSKSFDQQVLATPNYEARKHLLIIFHDSPDLLLGSNNSITTQQKPQDTWLVSFESPPSPEQPAYLPDFSLFMAHFDVKNYLLTMSKVDGTQSYIRWAVSHNFGVIDVNIPELITVDPDTADAKSSSFHTSGVHEPQDIEYSSNQTDLARREGEKLALYLWENYVEPYDFPGGIFLMGAGHAFHAVAKLVGENETVYPNLNGIIGFISTNPIRPVYNHNHPWLAQWYKDNSRIFVSRVHSLWKKDGSKASKRYGTLVRSEGTLLNQMMKLHEKEVFDWMVAKADMDGDEEEDDDDENENEKDDEDTKAERDTESEKDDNHSPSNQAPLRRQSDGDHATAIHTSEGGPTGLVDPTGGKQVLVPLDQGANRALGDVAVASAVAAAAAAGDNVGGSSNSGGDVYMTTE